MFRLSLIVMTLALMAAPMTACNRSNDSAAAAGLHVTLTADPLSFPGKEIAIQVTDDSGQPVTDVTVAAEGNMNHAGMVPVLTESMWDGADGAEDGVYHLPFQFTMMGDWIITVKIERRDGTILTQDFDVSATLGGVEVKN